MTTSTKYYQSRSFKVLLRRWGNRFLFLSQLGLFLFVVLFPFYWITVSSFTPRYDLFTIPPRYWPSIFTLENYRVLLENIPLVKYFANSMIFSIGSSLFSVITAFLASYALARIKFRGANLVFVGLLVSVALPPIGTLVPLFDLYKQLDLINTHHGLIILMASLMTPFTVWILVPFIQQVPFEVEEAALIDGARLPQVLWHIVLPILRPALVTLFLINFIIAWNELLYPLVFATTEATKTLSVGLIELSVEPTAGGGRPWHLLSSMSVTMIVPVLLIVLFFQRLIIGGLTRGAVK